MCTLLSLAMVVWPDFIRRYQPARTEGVMVPFASLPFISACTLWKHLMEAPSLAAPAAQPTPYQSGHNVQCERSLSPLADCQQFVVERGAVRDYVLRLGSLRCGNFIIVMVADALLTTTYLPPAMLSTKDGSQLNSESGRVETLWTVGPRCHDPHLPCQASTSPPAKQHADVYMS